MNGRLYPRNSDFSLLLAALFAFVAMFSAGCGGSKTPPPASIEANSESASDPLAVSTETPAAAPKKIEKRPAVDPIVVVHTSAGDFQIQLFAEKAPQTVDNFLRNYVQRDFYKDTIVHHVDANMLIAGGFDERLEPRETRAAIFNEAGNGLSNVRGTVALNRDADVAHSGTSQFFVNLQDNPGFDYQNDETEAGYGYCVFGKVIAGQDVVDSIAQAPVTQQGDFASVPTPLIGILSIEQIR